MPEETVEVPSPRQLEEIRRTNEYTQTEIADIVDISQSAVSRYENGHEGVIADDVLVEMVVEMDPYLEGPLKPDTRPVVTLADPPLGRMLTYWRDSFGITQREFADLLNTSQPHLSSIEKGHYEPSEDLKTRIAGVISRAEFGEQEVTITDESGDVVNIESTE